MTHLFLDEDDLALVCPLSDRAAPVMGDRTAAAHIGLDKELSDEVGVLFRGGPITSRRPRQAKTGKVQRRAFVSW